MRKLFFAIALLAALTASAASPLDQLGSLLGGSGSGNGTSDAIGNFINNTIANNKFTIDDLVGDWKYKSPAVSFQSGNVLQNIGGAAVATALEDQLEPYYRRLGFNRTTLTVDADHNFIIKLGLVTLKGTIGKTDDRLVFSFNAFGRVPLGTLAANATKAGDVVNLTFDAEKLINILNKVSGTLNNATLTTLTNLLNTYEGVYIGFKFTKA